MSKNWVTRCPQCQTSFRLTRDQLQAANGSVRCGSCLHVFKATQHIIPQSDGSSPSLDEATQFTGISPAPAAAPSQPSPVAPAEPPRERPALELSDDFQKLDARSPKSNDESDVHHDHVDGHEAVDESWATEMLKDLEKEEHSFDSTGKAAKRDADDSGATNGSDWQILEYETLFSAADAAQLDSSASSPTESTDNKEESFAGMRAERRALDELASEPLNLHLPEKTQWWKYLFYSVISLALMLLLLLQYAWMERDQLARQDAFRPYYQIACEHLQCALPDKINIPAIRGSNLVVRSHPRFENALVVDAIINNQASYGQPFPVIELSFSDLSGTTVATRRFKPDEYLSGELAGVSEMPSNTPIHLTLEIVDPGQKAVNYYLAFHPLQ